MSLSILTWILLSGSGNSAVAQGCEPVATCTVAAAGETEPTLDDGANDPAIWVNPADPGRSLIIGSGEGSGLEIYDLQGRRLGATGKGFVGLIDLQESFPLGGASETLVVASDQAEGAILIYALDGEAQALRSVGARALPTGFEIAGLCLYRSPVSDRTYAFAVDEAGIIQQWELFEIASGSVEGRMVRNLYTGFGAGHCTVDDDAQRLFVADETVGIWSMEAEPETDGARVAVDFVAPAGRIPEEVKGLTIYEQPGEQGYLIASAGAADTLLVYSRDGSRFVGQFAVVSSNATDALNDTGGLAASGASLGSDYPGGLLVAADDDNDGSETNYKLISWESVSDALGLPPAGLATAEAFAVERAVTVSPSVETEPVQGFGDAADDAAIWVNESDPGRSFIIGTQKQLGLYVYDLTGKVLQHLPDGKMNNVDLRYGFMLGGEPVALVMASNRTDNSINAYIVDGQALRLVDVADGLLDTGMNEPYGLCMYRSPVSARYYVFVTDDVANLKQWALEATSSGKVDIELVRELEIGSQSEGCVADDETGDLYIGEEDVGIWKYGAEPGDGARRTAVDSTEDGNLTSDIEGVTLYYGPDGSGYLIASNQGQNNFAVYNRAGDNKFIGLFHVIADPRLGIDGSSETDGIDVISTPLGSAFPYGLFIAQDGRNITPKETQNFKLVPWERIADAMNIEKTTEWHPRDALNDALKIK